MNDFLGKTVVNGQLKYGSVSSVKLFDTRTRGGCPRRWHKRYVGGEREPDSDNAREVKEAGTALDREVKHYLRTGEKNLSALAIKGLHILEQPGPGLAVDVNIHTVEYFKNGQPFAKLPPLPNGDQPRYPHDVEVVVHSQLTAAGIPFVGELDIVHSRGHYRDDDGEFHRDPPNTIEVADVKFKSNAKDRNGNSNFFMPSDLVRDIQMAGYGEWVGRVRPAAQHVRLSHLYFPKRPASALPTKVTRLHVLDDCRRTWEYVDGVVRYMADVAKETDIERVPGADKDMSCDAYSGCPHRANCSAYKRNSLDNLFNKIAEDHIQEKDAMGLIATTQPQLMQQAQSAPAPQMQQQLAQEEASMRAQVAQQQAQMPAPFNPNEYLAVCQRLGSYGFGMPSLAGNASMAYASAGGQNVAPGFVYQGVMAPPGAPYSLHAMTLTEVQQVYQLEREAAAKAQPAPQNFQPVQVPQTAHPFTQQVGAAYNQTIATQTPTAPFPSAGVSFLPPGAPESMPQLAQMQTAPAPAQAEAPAEKKTRGRPKKEGSGTAPEQTAAASPPPPSSAGAAPQVAPAAGPTFVQRNTAPAPEAQSEPSQVVILINARPASGSSRSLAGYVDYINGELAKRYCVTADGKPCLQDVRCAPKDSPLAFGGWKGAVREVVKVDPPQVDGECHLDTFMDELNEAVADALRYVAEQKGWRYYRGVR